MKLWLSDSLISFGKCDANHVFIFVSNDIAKINKATGVAALSSGARDTSREHV
jgi:hypothetical protein